MEDIKVDTPEVLKKYEDRGFKIGTIRISDKESQRFAIKKKPIQRVTDLTYENINHISASVPPRGHRAQLRWRMGEPVAEHTGHH